SAEAAPGAETAPDAQRPASWPRTMVVIPTYNELDNLPNIITAVRSLPGEIDVTIVDDGSPDGTGELADRIAREDSHVHVIHRKGKLGLGTAYVAGFRYALESGAEAIMEMDADFSHDPASIPEFLDRIADADIVIGSRYRNGIRVINWSFRRLLLSIMATKYVNLVTGMPASLVSDATAGFKCYRRKVLETIDLSKIHSNGYAFQIEMKYLAYRKGFRFAEVPITFNDRRVGISKMNGRIILEALWVCWRLRLGI
ncbi:MAG TPA: polyprenol monophosphomannose synthase, partial [Candidatus Saccharimonadales bacterium]|nr:polyprenol monophosphomannose synthase [Candidatus Saccharimonadales bacterium]